ncbi:acyl-CoA dehydrogenase family protein [Nocardioides sp.]|uniref:acyl-CoA dehydrogenase family protein n=1 Tax=Nocardioides sp. TaxID=35761 RepID=UPI00261DAE56|nr:acyl-CoA dehydrogenase family protein [Nocardioides sp.]MDI6912562.1 acyl-CoA dehydrogenase family protein [Nocardioides sp.]
MERRLLDSEHDAFRDTVREFIRREVAPHLDAWIADGVTPRDFWRRAGETGLLGISVPEEYGGIGTPDFRYNALLVEELCRAGSLGLASTVGIHTNIVAPYLTGLATPEQQERWLPGFVSGEIITALAMTEPDAGSDLKAIRCQASPADGGWVLNGQKTFITNGWNADLVIVAAKTDPAAGHRGMTLFAVPGDSPGFGRGRPLHKVGQRESDTAELFFDDVWIPRDHLLGEVSRGFYHLMEGLAQERLSVSVMAVACCEAILEATTTYVRDRQAFGGRLADLQHIRMTLATLATETDIARVYVDRCIEEHNAGALSAFDAAKAKWWTTEVQRRVADECLQLHGGYGYMDETAISRAWRDGRIQTVYAGSTETLKDYIGRQLTS